MIITVVDEKLTANESEAWMVWGYGPKGLEIDVLRGHEEDIECYSHEFSEITIGKCVNFDCDDYWIADIMLGMS